MQLQSNMERTKLANSILFLLLANLSSLLLKNNIFWRKKIPISLFLSSWCHVLLFGFLFLHFYAKFFLLFRWRVLKNVIKKKFENYHFSLNKFSKWSFYTCEPVYVCIYIYSKFVKWTKKILNFCAPPPSIFFSGSATACKLRIEWFYTM